MIMTLGFSTHWPDKMGNPAGKPNFFVEKIWAGLEKNKVEFIDLDGFSDHSVSDLKKVYSDDYDERFRDSTKDNGWSIYHKPIIYPPKLHTIRHDPHNRWKPGVKIHMVINNRTKNRFQFVPVMECVDTQEIEIMYLRSKPELSPVMIEGRMISLLEILDFAQNDGFDSVVHFFRWFNQDTKPNTKIIHWTPLKY